MIKEKEYKKRRYKFGKKLEKNSVALISAATQKIRSNDTEFPYRQDSNFYYLTGFKEDNAALVFVKTKNSCKSYLFVEKKDPKMELWTGKRLGAKAAKKRFAVDGVFNLDELDTKLKEFFKKKGSFYYDYRREDSLIKKYKRLAKKEDLELNNAATIVEKLRLIKSPAELALIEKSVEITKEAHHRAMKISKELANEYELLAEIEYIFKKRGAYNDAYTSVIASGNNANTLHYIENNQALKTGELILIDAGCEYEYYASDVTRTIPVSGKFTKEQKELYQLVLDVEKQIIAMIKPKVLRSELHKKAEKLLCEGMVELGILKGSVKKLLKKGAHKKYFPHGIGHYMGIDVHDQNPYKTKKGKEIPLKAGMVLTIEPGLYLPKDDKKVPKKYRGIGIRIEDDILVTKDGYKNLSKDINKEIEDIENIS
ncbi:MAG: aminopeptidase P N-terminal domain-containing protein [Sulfurimonas sp.]